ncbi:MAG TPA: UDP-N-acetylmuramate dehydrogenase [Candidatus Portnoybacteria bacterium]|nr:UDP-N-acetylmuramate dehydrogenase [Candidatus Portnoybacteria bacterium]
MSKSLNFQENINLADYTTFRIGGTARYFVAVKNKEELMEALRFAKNNSLPFFILGGGSNLLVSDSGFNGLAIKMQNESIKMQDDGKKCKIICDAGVLLGKIIIETSRLGYSGAEWGFGIPGTIGGAICGNAGRLGQDISQVVESVTVLDEGLNIKTLSKEECGFGYRSSRFKESKEIILSASLLFIKKEPAEIEAVLNEAKAAVKQALPFPSAGCVFKNYKVKGESDELLKNHPELIERIRGGKIGVGYLIDQCGLKGKQVGGAKIWENHANYIINLGGAKAQDVMALIKMAKEAIKNKYGIEMEEEIRYI